MGGLRQLHLQLGQEDPVSYTHLDVYKRQALNMSLFLSGNAEDVKAAVSAGEPAGHLRPSRVVDDVDDTVLRAAFDFDGVLADDAAEQYYRSAPGIDDYLAHENAHRDEALDPGPVSYTHLDVYKRQGTGWPTRRGSSRWAT